MAKPKAGTSEYSTNTLAQNAVNQLSGSLEGLRVNDLDAYLSDQLRRDYSQFTDYNSILGKYNRQWDAAWELSKQQQTDAMNRAEAQNYANTRDAVAQMRNTLAGSASNGRNVGAANASALQALLGLGQQNSATTTEGMQNYQNTSKEAAAARAANAVSSLDAAREGTNSMYDQATSAYGADHTYGMQGVADSLGTVTTAADTNASSERMNNATNLTNLAIEQTTKRTENTNRNKDTSVNRNYNYDKDWHPKK